MQRIRRDGAEYRALMSHPELAMLVIAHVIEDCNETACRVLGRPRTAIVGHSPLAFSAPLQDDGRRAASSGRARIDGALAGQPQWFRWRFLDERGAEVAALIHLEALELDGRRRLVAHLQNLSRLLTAEASLRESEQRLHQVLDHASALVFWKDLDGRHLFVNDAFCRVVGRPANEILGRRDVDFIPADVAARFRANDRVIVEARRAVSFEEQGVFNGELCTYLVNKFPLLDDAGVPYAVCGIATDISARKRTEEALRQAALAVSSARGVTLFQELVRLLGTTLAADWVFIATRSSRPDYMHVLALWADGDIAENFDYALAGTPCETVVGQTFRFYPERLGEQFAGDEAFRRLGMDSYAGLPLDDAQGERLGLIAAVSRRPLGDPGVVESVLKIFAVRVVAEFERERMEQTLRATVEASLDCIVAMDADGLIREFNPAAEACFGYRSADAIGRSLADLLIPPRFRHAHREGMARFAATGAGPFIGRRVEVVAQRADGSEFPAELAIALARSGDRDIFVGYLRDITERKDAEAERIALEARLRQAQKMEAIGHLSGGIAHDFNNILTTVTGYLALAGDRQAELGDAKLARYLDRAHAACGRAGDLIRQMLTFSRGQRGAPRPLSLAALVRELALFLHPMLPSSIDFEVDRGDEDVVAVVDPVQIEQVLMNLCINARDALGGRGRIRVSVGRRDGVEAVCASCRAPVVGAFAALSVADDGPGVPDMVLERVFEPFFSTKEVGKGSGMGLAMVHGIVHEHRGHVLIDAGPLGGARFTVLLPPLGAGDAKVVGGDGAESEAARRSRLDGRVLLVEDDPMVAGFLRELLEGWGLDVVAAADGLAARDQFVAHPDAFDVVLTDHTMPRMTGLELVREIAHAKNTAAVILLTAHADAVDDEVARAAGAMALLRKPVDPATLHAELARFLRQAA